MLRIFTCILDKLLDFDNSKIPSTEQDGVFNVMSMGKNGSSLAWMTMIGVKDVQCAEHIGRIVHISLRITDTNYTYISQRITGHLEAGESRRAVSDKALYIALRLYISSSKTLEI